MPESYTHKLYRVRVLESLGYYVKIKGSFLVLPDGSLANISDPYIAANLYNDGGDRSLIDLNIYDIDQQDILGEYSCWCERFCCVIFALTNLR